MFLWGWRRFDSLFFLLSFGNQHEAARRILKTCFSNLIWTLNWRARWKGNLQPEKKIKETPTTSSDAMNVSASTYGVTLQNTDFGLLENMQISIYLMFVLNIVKQYVCKYVCMCIDIDDFTAIPDIFINLSTQNYLHSFVQIICRKSLEFGSSCFKKLCKPRLILWEKKLPMRVPAQSVPAFGHRAKTPEKSKILAPKKWG